MAAETFLLVWTREGCTHTRGPFGRDEALRQFDCYPEFQRAASLGQGRLRVMRERDYRASEVR